MCLYLLYYSSFDAQPIDNNTNQSEEDFKMEDNDYMDKAVEKLYLLFEIIKKSGEYVLK